VGCDHSCAYQPDSDNFFTIYFVTARTGKPRPLLHIFDVFKLTQNQSPAGYFDETFSGYELI
jgi:hypothetical protein